MSYISRDGAKRTKAAVEAFEAPGPGVFRRRPRIFGASAFRPAIIQSATKDGSNNRWTYSVKRARVDNSGAWPTLTAYGDAFDAYNLVEINNGSTGIMGGGVNLGDQFVKSLGVVRIGEVVVCFKISGAWFFERLNPITVDCD
ncbi:MAG: hypothetical protein AAF916_04190 [Planctomycetota bacterium]